MAAAAPLPGFNSDAALAEIGNGARRNANELAEFGGGYGARISRCAHEASNLFRCSACNLARRRPPQFACVAARTRRHPISRRHYPGDVVAATRPSESFEGSSFFGRAMSGRGDAFGDVSGYVDFLACFAGWKSSI